MKAKRTNFEKVATADDMDVSVVSWYVIEIVNTMFTYVGSRPVTQVLRSTRKTNTTQHDIMEE